MFQRLLGLRVAIFPASLPLAVLALACAWLVASCQASGRPPGLLPPPAPEPAPVTVARTDVDEATTSGQAQLRLTVRWPGQGYRRTSALPASTRSLRFRVWSGRKLVLEQLLVRSSGAATQSVDIRVPVLPSLDLEAHAFREASPPATGSVPVASGKVVGLRVTSALVTPVSLTLLPSYVPQITGLGTEWGHGGDTLWLSGTGLDEGTGTEVEFSGGATASATVLDAGHAYVVVPDGAQPGPLRVTADGIRGVWQAWYWVLPPEMASLDRVVFPEPDVVRAGWDPSTGDERIVIAGGSLALRAEAQAFALAGDAVPWATRSLSVSWHLDDATLGGVTGDGRFLAGHATGTTVLRVAHEFWGERAFSITVASLSLEASPSSIFVDLRQAGATDSVQLAVRQRLSTGQDLLSPMAWLDITSSDTGVPQVSADGLVRLTPANGNSTVSVVSRVASLTVDIPVFVTGLPSGTSLIRSGTFQMGSPSSESGRSSNETQHQVTLTRDFLMQTTEVTQGQWRALMGNNPSRFTGDDNRPVEQVSWYDAVAYANALSAKDGLAKAYDLSSCSGTPGAGNYGCSNVTLTASTPYATTGWRLPTEAEWEYAYRAGSTTPWFFGADSNLLGTYAWFSSNSGSTTRPVGQKLPNFWGLYDMAGNVWEWCWDWYGTYPGTVTDPTGPTSGPARVFRGGSWYNGASYARAAYRDGSHPGGRGNGDFGFRLSRSRP